MKTGVIQKLIMQQFLIQNDNLALRFLRLLENLSMIQSETDSKHLRPVMESIAQIIITTNDLAKI